MTSFDDDDDILDDKELPDKSDIGDPDDDGVATEPCPYCGKPVYEQADVCPYCRNFISFEDAPTGVRRRYPLWIIVGLLLALVSMVLIGVL